MQDDRIKKWSLTSMKLPAVFFSLLLAELTVEGQIATNVSQLSISGNAQASALGSPFGQSFVPTSPEPIIGVGLAVVGNTGVGDIQLSLYRSDESGSALVGSPITSGNITAAQLNSYYTPGTTPLWFPVYFDQPYLPTPGERLAFTIAGGGSLDFYYASGVAYSGGRLLADGTKDLTFATLVPEPGTVPLCLLAGSTLVCRRLKRLVNKGEPAGLSRLFTGLVV